jgi:tetratricopeptide (TPR) repeat protein
VTRHELEDERTFLLRSLEDLDREHDAGDLSDDDHATLRDGYIARTAQVLRRLEDGSPAADDTGGGEGRRPRGHTSPPVTTGRRLPSRRRLLITAGLVLVIGCAFLSVVVHLGPRLPGESVTGSVTLTPSEQVAQTLAQAETDESEGDAVDAVKLYQSVLHRDPTEEQALAELGWLEFEAGAQDKQGTLLSLGEGEEQEAERVDPGDFAPHLYLGSMLLSQGDAAGAVAQYRRFLADHPPRAKVSAATPFIIRAFSDARVAIPALPPSAPAGG